jgi:hypothetical protein
LPLPLVSSCQRRRSIPGLRLTPSDLIAVGALVVADDAVEDGVGDADAGEDGGYHLGLPLVGGLSFLGDETKTRLSAMISVRYRFSPEFLSSQERVLKRPSM